MKKILIVDDEESIRLNLCVFLEDEGYEVQEHDSAESALALLSTEHYHGVIVDLRLPGMDGTEFIKRAHEIDSRLGFLIHTGSTEFSLSEELRAIGVSPEYVLNKPVRDMARITQLLEEVIRK